MVIARLLGSFCSATACAMENGGWENPYTMGRTGDTRKCVAGISASDYGTERLEKLEWIVGLRHCRERQAHA